MTERDALVTFYVTVIAFDVTAISKTLQSLSVIETWMKEFVQIDDRDFDDNFIHINENALFVFAVIISYQFINTKHIIGELLMSFTCMYLDLKWRKDRELRILYTPLSPFIDIKSTK